MSHRRRVIIGRMNEQANAAPDVDDSERRGLWPSVGLVVAITAITWLAIAMVFGLGRAGISAFGGVGSGASGLLVWAALWIAMWAAITLTVGSGLAAAFRAWAALYPTFNRPAARATVMAAGPTTSAGDPIDEVKRLAIEEAEALLRRDRD